jgi:hypothetical protein
LKLSISSKNMPKPLDPFWVYGIPEDGTNRQKLNCKLCGVNMSGGICRLKYHLAKIPGHDVGPCPKTNPEIMRIAYDALETKDKNKDEKAARKNEISLRSSGTSAAEGQGSGRGSTDSGTASRRPSSYFPERTTPGAQPGIRSMLKKKEKKEADRAVGRCLFYSDIPLSITKNNPFWQPMCDAIAVVGPGYKSPTFEELRGPILQEEKADINSRLAEFKKSWEISGCTVMSDGWTDRKGRSLLNFLVHCPRGTMFIKSIDASAHVKDAALLCELMDAFIHEIGVHNVVQIITDNAANYVAAGRLLMERNRSLFWTPCAAHCIDLMLEDMGKTSFIKEVIDQARSIPKFIYNHIWVLSLMRRHTRNRELRRPAITRFATNFITLQSLLQCQFELKQMFVCDEWRDSTYSRKEDGRAIARLVYSDSFWEGVAEVCSVTEPLVKVLRLVDSDKPVMGYLYEAMDKAKEAIRAYYVGKGSHGFQRQMLLWDLIDTRWTGMLHRPIHAAAIFLNPAFSYKCNFDFDGEVMEGLHACLQRMVPDVAIRLDINREIEMYRDGTGLFGYEDAIASRSILLPRKSLEFRR